MKAALLACALVLAAASVAQAHNPAVVNARHEVSSTTTHGPVCFASSFQSVKDCSDTDTPTPP
jgi:hypothetical protein